MKKFNSDEERTVWYKELAKEYPFLIPASAWTGKIDKDFDFCYLKGFFESGWEDSWLKYCEKIKPEFDRLTETFREKIKGDFVVKGSIEELNALREAGLPYIADTKEKFGSARVYWSSETNEMRKLTGIFEMISSATCCKCGKQPVNSRGEHIIWLSSSWICPYCKEHFKEDWKGSERLSEFEKKELKELTANAKTNCKTFSTSSYGPKEGSDKKIFIRTRKTWGWTKDNWLEVIKEETEEEKCH